MFHELVLVSKSWLGDFVAIPKNLTTEKMSKLMTTRMVEVEGVRSLAVQPLDKVVVGVVKKLLPHPNADKLRLVDTDIGTKVVRMVCGGTNVSEGMRVAVALPGARVKWHGECELVELKETEIRGETSIGMICASSEIGLDTLFPEKGAHHILDISRETKAKAGTALIKALGLEDSIFDIDNKSLTHRPDLWGHYGMARDFAAVAGMEFKEQDITKNVFTKKSGTKLPITVQDSTLCPRYTAVRMDDIRIESSPYWLRKRLVAAGIRPINNIVDITNYVLLELGQPMHAFDAERVGQITVRCAKKTEKLVTLDEVMRKLDDSMLVIADEKKPIALAGIMGGGTTGVTENTTSIIFESANFDASSVRMTSTKLGLRSESSMRFEKSLDPELALQGLARAVELVQKLLPEARIDSQVYDAYKKPKATQSIHITHEHIECALGGKIPAKEIQNILTRFGFVVRAVKGVYTVGVPHWRRGKDVAIEEDLIEEIGRGYGYDRLTPKLPAQPIAVHHANPVKVLKRDIRREAVALGMTEVFNYSFARGDDAELIGMREKDLLTLENPTHEQQPYLRSSLLPHLLRNVVTNEREYAHGRLFEIGRVFKKGKGSTKVRPGATAVLPPQPEMCAGVVWGKKDAVWNEGAELVRRLTTALGVSVSFQQSEDHLPLVHPYRTATLWSGDRYIGFVGEVHPRVSKTFDLQSKALVWELLVEEISALQKNATVFSALPNYPASLRDIAFVVDEKIRYTDIEEVIQKNSDLLEVVELFDVFNGQDIGKGKKSMAFHLTFRADDRTLTDKEVDKEMQRIQESLKKECNAHVRR